MNLDLYQHNTISFNKNFRPVQVDSKLLRGCATVSPRKIKKLKEDGITQIIDLRNSGYIKKQLEKFLCQIFGIKYINCKFSHRQKTLPNSDFFEQINKLILSAQGKTLLHCEYGKHRTSITTAIYEKKVNNNSTNNIIQNMINNGYIEITSDGKTKKEKKYIDLYNQMFNEYLK